MKKTIKFHSVRGFVSENEEGVFIQEIEQDSLTPGGRVTVKGSRYGVLDCGHLATKGIGGRCSCGCGGALICKDCGLVDSYGHYIWREHAVKSIFSPEKTFCKRCKWRGWLLGF